MHDVAIIGGGPVGLSAALAAAAHGMRALVLEAHTQPGVRPGRVFALSHGARLILERLGAWCEIRSPSSIRSVHVSQRGRFGHTVLHAAELELDALGYVVAEDELVRALRARAAQVSIDFVAGARVQGIESGAGAAEIGYEHAGDGATARARIVAQADGGASLAAPGGRTERDYRQCAFTAMIQSPRLDAARAYERFTGAGPIALLPCADRHALIWTVPQSEAASLDAMTDAAFVRALVQSYGERLGEARLVGARACFPLQLRFAHRIAGNRHVLIGNAAQTLHPVAGQGFNLGLRDAFELARALAEARRRGQDLLQGLKGYRAGRRLDRTGGAVFTDFLVRMFSNDDPLLGVARGAGLYLLDASGPAKRFLMRRMIFGSRI
ncbi:MAG: FAD-dependent monooxygenase [Burkholderiales bacterium]|nr:FAD-dependent monooxygenase [Burkholderiales bacterium]